MRLNRVPMLFDYKDLRGQFIFSTMHSELAFLDAKGHVHLLKSEIQAAILAVFMEQEVRPEKEFAPQINIPTSSGSDGLTPGDWCRMVMSSKGAHPPIKPQINKVAPEEVFVGLVERIARAVRG